MTCRWWHRWCRWRTEFLECPDGRLCVVRVRTRDCKRCPMTEEEYLSCV